ncbi:hypothetical protein A8709_18210 [Paenibacillus pectinilyticus]|uniref:Fibronectin type III-like domain-containing protein n=1 Tax=Paenibacillus pectinilyticus TaxID=512399 RepID=A0A1C0ZZR7_9BACL|nr:hypothetical protein A8709_18210 [Paenibacillus pectinilyticus]
MNKKALKDTELLNVSVCVTNTGSCIGQEVVQLYVRDIESSVIRPDKELKGFEKVELAPGQFKTLTFHLNKRSFAYYDVGACDWTVETGDFELLIAQSSQDIILSETVTIESDYRTQAGVSP